jgi:CO/xanthine dehydrogenase Mo-binding subunit
VAEVIRGHFGLVGGEVTGVGSFVPARWSGSLGGATVFWETGMGAAEVEVDPDTGAVRVRRYVSAADVGQAINPRECAAQDEGAAIMGLGPALFEARAGEHGQLLNPGLIDYRLPTFADLPDAFETILVENADGPGPVGAKGDEATGVVTVLRYVSVADIGRAINPRECHAQEEGGAMMGLGHTFYEQMVYEDGQLLNPSLIDYRVPVMGDLPAEYRSILIENGDGPGPCGAKGFGESGLLPTAPAIANAVARAVGVRVTDLPLTAERVWRAIQAAKGETR